jgi:aldehyde dehydrogenase (NAD+)
MAQTAAVNVPKLNKTINVPTGLFINNEFVPSVDSQERIEYVTFPTDKHLVSTSSPLVTAPSTPRPRR